MASALPRTARVAVIGAGAMGIDIVQVAAQAGHPVALFDVRDGRFIDGPLSADVPTRTVRVEGGTIYVSR